MTIGRSEQRMAREEQLRMRRFARLGSFIDVLSGVAGPTARIVALRARGNSRVDLHRVQRDGSLSVTAIRGVPEIEAEYLGRKERGDA